METKHQWTSEEYLEYLKTGKKPEEQTTKQVILKQSDSTSKPKDKKVPVNTKTLSDERLAIFNLLRIKLEERKAIWIPGNTVSQKNSKEIGKTPNGKMSLKSYIAKTKVNTKPAEEICNTCADIKVMTFIPSLRNSKAVEEYKHEHEKDFLQNKILFHNLVKNLKPPYILGAYYIRETQHDFDINNANHIWHDMGKDAGWYEDDNANFVWPTPLGWHWDKNNPGCIIIPLNNYLETIIKTI